jgi:hypothetical protein
LGQDPNFQSSTNPGFCFRGIPPERIGLHGGYDHYGLAKRVAYTFHMRYAPVQLQQLRVTQRGSVVILSGQISSRQLLTQLINLALTVTGTLDVETCGVRVEEGLMEREELRFLDFR